MPRSSPNTEAALLEVELDLQFHAPQEQATPPTFRLRPIHLVGLFPALVIGLSLVPRIDEVQPVLVSVETLPEPAVATTAALLPAESHASLTNLTFELMPIDLGRNDTLVGPATLNDRLWLIASADGVPVVYSSRDNGVTWEQTGEVASGSETVVIHDLVSFGGSLVALGTTSSTTGPAAIFGYPDQVVLWRSSDGTRWNEDLILPSDGHNSHALLRIITDGRTILIGGRESEVGGSMLESVVPEYLVPAVIAGKLDAVVQSGTHGLLSVLAPPGIEVWRSQEAVSLPDGFRSVLYRSDDLKRWEEVDVEPGLILSEMVVKPGGGYVVPSSSGDMYSAMDGRGWGRNLTVPPATYRRWGEWLVGMQFQGGVDRLVIGAGTSYATVDQPLNSSLIWSAGGDFAGGPAGLVSLVPTYLGLAPPVTVTSGSQIFMLSDGRFSVSAPGGGEALVVFQQLPGSFDPASNTVSIDLGGGEQVPIDLDDLQGLRADINGQWETHVYSSPDAMRWSQSNIAFPTSDVEVLGALPDGFLIAVGQRSISERFVELYRTGPLPSGVTD